MKNDQVTEQILAWANSLRQIRQQLKHDLDRVGADPRDPVSLRLTALGGMEDGMRDVAQLLLTDTCEGSRERSQPTL